MKWKVFLVVVVAHKLCIMQLKIYIKFVIIKNGNHAQMAYL